MTEKVAFRSNKRSSTERCDGFRKAPRGFDMFCLAEKIGKQEEQEKALIFLKTEPIFNATRGESPN